MHFSDGKVLDATMASTEMAYQCSRYCRRVVGEPDATWASIYKLEEADD